MNNITTETIRHNIDNVVTKVDYYGTQKNIIIFSCYVINNFKKGYYGKR